MLLDAAETEYPFETVVFEVVDGEIVRIEKQSEPTGVVLASVRSQEAIYIGWLASEHPDDFDSLTIAGQPLTSFGTTARHRELASDWFDASG